MSRSFIYHFHGVYMASSKLKKKSRLSKMDAYIWQKYHIYFCQYLVILIFI